MRIAYIDHFIHKKTKSTFFLRKILKKQGHKITNFWDNSWREGKYDNLNNLNQKEFDAIIFFHVLPPIWILKKINCQNIIWIPMFDAVIKVNPFRYLNCKALGIKMLSFSKALSKRFRRLGLDNLEIQYFPKPKIPNLKKSQELTIFFWFRNNRINWQLVKNIIAKNKIKKIYLKNAFSDINQRLDLPNKQDFEKYHIKILDKWISQKKYLDIVSKCNLYIAPRVHEGIGMSFLEAMALNIPVIAVNKPTMNEYIQHNKTGYLYNLDHPKQLKFSNLSTIKINLKKYMANGYQKWLKQQFAIIEFIKKPKNQTTFLDNWILSPLAYIIDFGYEKMFRINWWLKHKTNKKLIHQYKNIK